MRFLGIPCLPLFCLWLETRSIEQCQREGDESLPGSNMNSIMAELASMKNSFETFETRIETRLESLEKSIKTQSDTLEMSIKTLEMRMETRLDNLSAQIEAEREFGVQRSRYLQACTASIRSTTGQTTTKSGIMTLLQFPECGCTFLASALHVAKNLRLYDSVVGGQAWQPNAARTQWDFARLDVWVSPVNDSTLHAIFPRSEKVPCKVQKPSFRVGEKIAIYSPAHVVKVSLGVLAGQEEVAFVANTSGIVEPILRPHGVSEDKTTQVLLCSADLYAGYSGSAVSNHEILGIAVAEVDCGAYQGGPDTRRCAAVVPSQTILEELKKQDDWCADFCSTSSRDGTG